MIALVLWFLAAFGFAFIVGHSKISLATRQLLGGWTETSVTNDLRGGEVVGHVVPHKPLVPVAGPWIAALLECPACLGFWFGGLAGFLAPALVIEPAAVLSDLGAPAVVAAVFLALATSAVNLLLSKWVGLV